jgi:transcriptional repressor NrdR
VVKRFSQRSHSRRRERFDRQKVLNGLLQACQKRNVSAAQMQQIVDETEAFVVDSAERESQTAAIGELIMQRLKEIDTVAYIRFASVYRDFKDVREFKAELEELLSGRQTGAAAVGHERKRALKG